MSSPDTVVGRYLLKPLCPYIKPIFRILLRVTTYGCENIPKGKAFIVASNHRSHLDPPLLNSVFPEPLTFLAKEELFKPPLGWFIKHMRTIPVKRGKGDTSALETALELLSQGYPVAIFPEGTRAEPGNFLKPKIGVGLLAIKSKAPVIPVLIEGTDKILPRGSKIPRFFHSVKVFIGFPKTYVNQEDNPRGYKKVALDIMEEIKKLHYGLESKTLV